MKTLAFGVCLMAAASALASDAAAADHRVVIDGMAFTPKVVSARPGDTITWVNTDMFVHNVTAAGTGIESGIKSGDLAPGKTWRHTVRQGEAFDYLCTLHPVMTGRVEVQEVKAALKPARRRSTS
jgi:plastocyanin